MPIDPDTIADNAALPAHAEVDGRVVEQHPIPDQIAAAKFKGAADALAGSNPGGGSRSGWNALRPARVVPPGGA